MKTADDLTTSVPEDDVPVPPSVVSSVDDRLTKVRNALTLICASTQAWDDNGRYVDTKDLMGAVHEAAADALGELFWIGCAAERTDPDFTKVPAPTDDELVDLETLGAR